MFSLVLWIVLRWNKEKPSSVFLHFLNISVTQRKRMQPPLETSAPVFEALSCRMLELRRSTLKCHQRWPITPCRVCSIPAPELCSSHPVNSQHPAEHAVFCWWCAQIHRCAGCMLSLWLSAVVITQKRGTGHVFFVFFMHGKIDTNYEMCTFLNHILILASFLI